MNNKDYIPDKDWDFLQWVINFLKQLATMLTRLGFPESEYQLLTMLCDDFAAKLTLAQEPATRTTVTVQNRKDARKTLEKTLRIDIKEFLNFNRHLTNGDRDALGLPIYKTGRTQSPIATKHPFFEVYCGEIRRLMIYFFGDEGKRSKAKPPGQRGVEIRWAILGAPPRAIDELINSSFDTRSPFTLTFDEYQRGKTVYFCLCWENTRGEKGPWSEIASAIIP
jgi:hypothetical protein